MTARGSARGPSAPAHRRPPRVDAGAERIALGRVQHALREGRFAQALAELDDDDRTFAEGALREERAAARVLGTCGRGDISAGQRLAEAFVARHPGSPLRARVLASCAPDSRGRLP